MADVGRMLAGFLQGSTGFAVDRIKARDDEAAQLRKTQLLETLRRDTQTYLADYEDKLLAKRGSSDFSGTEGDEFVTRNNRGEELARRSLTADEKNARQYTNQKRSLDLASAQTDIEYKKGSLDLRKQELASSAADRAERAEDRRQARQDRKEDREARNGVGKIDLSDPYTFGNALQSLESKAVEDAIKDGIPASKVSQLAAISAQNSSAKARKEGRTPNIGEARDLFLRSLDVLYGGVEGTGSEANWTPSSYQAYRSGTPSK